MWQFIVVSDLYRRYIVLQCVQVCCRVCRSVSQCVAVCVAVCRSVSQCVVVCCSVLHVRFLPLFLLVFVAVRVRACVRLCLVVLRGVCGCRFARLCASTQDYVYMCDCVCICGCWAIGYVCVAVGGG